VAESVLHLDHFRDPDGFAELMLSQNAEFVAVQMNGPSHALLFALVDED